jgi:hypothetical protein
MTVIFGSITKLLSYHDYNSSFYNLCGILNDLCVRAPKIVV